VDLILRSALPGPISYHIELVGALSRVAVAADEPLAINIRLFPSGSTAGTEGMESARKALSGEESGELFAVSDTNPTSWTHNLASATTSAPPTYSSDLHFSLSSEEKNAGEFDTFMGADGIDDDFNNYVVRSHSSFSGSSSQASRDPWLSHLSAIVPVNAVDAPASPKPKHVPLSTYEGLYKLGVFAFPIIVTALIQVLTSITTLGYIGRLNSAEYMGAVTLGNMVCNVSGFSLSYGLSTALDTLISQAYGARMYSLMGLHAQRAIVILSLCTIPVVVIWTYTGEFLFYVLAIDSETSMLAGQWAKYIRYGIWPALVFDILRKFLYGQQVVWPIVASSFCALVLNVMLNAIYHGKHFISVVAGDGGQTAAEIQPGGFATAGMSVVICQWVALATLIVLINVRKWVLRRKYSYSFVQAGTSGSPVSPVYTRLAQDDNGSTAVATMTPMTTEGTGAAPDGAVEYDIAVEDNWPALSRNIFRDWRPFLSLGIPGAFSLFFEWGSFETIAGIAGQLGAIGLATHGIFMSTAGLFYMFPAAISQATAILAGNYLGNNDASGCQFIVKLGLWVDFCWGLVAGSFLVFWLRPYWAFLYTNQTEVQHMIFTTLPIMLLYITVDSTKCITLNILRSTGRPGVTVLGNVVACLFVMLPGGYLLALRWSFGLVGLWFAMSLAWLVATVAYLYIVVATDWQSQADAAHGRNVHAAEEALADGKGGEAVELLAIPSDKLRTNGIIAVPAGQQDVLDYHRMRDMEMRML